MGARERDDDPPVEEERGDGDRLVEQPARVLAQIEHEPVHALPLEHPGLPAEHDGGADTERAQAEHAPAAAGIGEELRVDDGGANRGAADVQVESPASAHELESYVRPGRPEDPRERRGHGEPQSRCRADSDDRVARPDSRLLRRPRPQRHDHEALRRREHADADAGVVRRRLLAEEPVVGRAEIRGVGVAERREHLPDRAEVEHGGRDRAVVALGERLPHLVDDAGDGDGRGGAAALREPVSERERPDEHERQGEEDERAPHLDGASIRRRSAGC